MTGCSRIPYGGFEEKMKIYFKHDCPPMCDCYPTSSACARNLVIPIHIAVGKLSEKLVEGVKCSPGFGRP
jgi:Ubiquitin-protein ligase